MEWILQTDNRILNFIAEHLHTPFGDILFPFITALGNAGLIWIAVSLLLLFLPKWRRCGIQMLTALLFTVVAGSLILKPLIARERPFTANGITNLLIAAPRDFSFPSGHTSSSFAAAAVLFRKSRPAGTAAAVLAALIAFSRLYLYVHYPSDVLAGVLLGLLCAWAAVKLINKFAKQRSEIVKKL